MKRKIHPKYYDNVVVTCACGNSFVTGSTQAEMEVEICYKCHPYYTGKQTFIDKVGRIDKFKKKQEEAKRSDFYKRRKKKAEKKAEKKEEGPKTLREMLKELQ